MRIRRGNKLNCNFTLIIKKGQRVVLCTHTHLPARILARIRSVHAKFNDKMSYYLRAYYGKHLDNKGRMVQFDNEGTWFNKKDTIQAFRAFKEI